MIVKAPPATKYEIVYEMINQQGNLMNVKQLCGIAGVSRSGYYAWLKAEPARKEREARDRSDFAEIVKAYKYRGYDKGGRGIHMRLLRHEPPILMNLKKIYRLMRKYNLRCPIRKANPHRRIMKALKTNNKSPNILNREFKAHGMRAVLLTDITYLKRQNGSFSYLSAIMDAGSKEILAYVISPSLEIDFVLETVEQLIKNHGNELKTDALLHSDQGSHYTSHKFVELLKNKELRQSMSRRANCWDNAPQESFFGHMKEEIDLSCCTTHDGIAAVISDWIDYYNNDRYQWDLAKLSPREYYKYTATGVYPPGIQPPKMPVKHEYADDENSNAP